MRNAEAVTQESLRPGGENHTGKLRGLACMLAACLLFSLMTVTVYAVTLCQPGLPFAVVSFVRILVNLAVLMIPALLARQVFALFGDLRASLWLRGLFGTVALMLAFNSIQRIGPGESAFLLASSGVFVVLLGPLLLGQRNSAAAWLAVAGAFTGVFLLFEPRGWGGADFLGRCMALGSGFLSALAYLMVARAGRSNSPQSVIFYFCLVALVVHLLYFLFEKPVAPGGSNVWALLLMGGLAASGAQFYMTRAYQLAPAALVSAVGYLSPVLSLLWSVLLFSRTPDPKALAGCGLVLVCGVFLPFLTAQGRARP